jgi:hypothetical protein
MIKRIQDFLQKNIKIISLFMLLVLIIQAIFIGYMLKETPKNDFNGIFINVGKLDEQAKVVYVKDSVYKSNGIYETKTFYTYAVINDTLFIYNCIQTDKPVASYKLPGTLENYSIFEDYNYYDKEARILISLICKSLHNECIFITYKMSENEDNPYITKLFEHTTKCKYIISLSMITGYGLKVFLLQSDDYLNIEYVDLNGKRFLKYELNQKTILRSSYNDRIVGFDGNYLYCFILLEKLLGYEYKLLINRNNDEFDLQLENKENPIFIEDDILYNGKTLYFFDAMSLEIKYQHDTVLNSYSNNYFTNWDGLFFINIQEDNYELINVSDDKNLYMLNSNLTTYSSLDRSIFYKVSDYEGSQTIELGCGFNSVSNIRSARYFYPIFFESEVGKPVSGFQISDDSYIITEKGYVYKLTIDNKSWIYK